MVYLVGVKGYFWGNWQDDQSTDESGNISPIDYNDWSSYSIAESYRSGYQWATAGLTIIIYGLILIGNLTREGFSRKISLFLHLSVLVLQFAVRVLFALFICINLSPDNSHNETPASAR